MVNNAVNTSTITISVSPYTWNLLTDEIKNTASSKNINIVLLEGNYIDDGRWKTKQNVITDIDDIRSGAALGLTALQDIPDDYKFEIATNEDIDLLKFN